MAAAPTSQTIKNMTSARSMLPMASITEIAVERFSSSINAINTAMGNEIAAAISRLPALSPATHRAKRTKRFAAKISTTGMMTTRPRTITPSTVWGSYWPRVTPAMEIVISVVMNPIAAVSTRAKISFSPPQICGKPPLVWLKSALCSIARSKLAPRISVPLKSARDSVCPCRLAPRKIAPPKLRWPSA